MLLTRNALLLGLVLSHGWVWAQGALRDPTTPPPGVKLPAAAGDKNDAGMNYAQTAPFAIRITPVGARKQAVINGRALLPGEQFQQWRLVTITANSAVFKDGRGTRTVALAPSSVSKKPAAGHISEK
jgi:hypothetical protein